MYYNAFFSYGKGFLDLRKNDLEVDSIDLSENLLCNFLIFGFSNHPWGSPFIKISLKVDYHGSSIHGRSMGDPWGFRARFYFFINESLKADKEIIKNYHGYHGNHTFKSHRAHV